MSNTCRIRIARDDYQTLLRHLYPGDGDEHGAVLLAGAAERTGHLTLYIREIHLARDGADYVPGKHGYRALSPTFIHKLITRARDERLVYLAAHNHASDETVAFSKIDIESHERGYPALLQIARGMPVGALVLGRRSMQADVWLPTGRRLDLKDAIVVGNCVHRVTPYPDRSSITMPEAYDRQIRMFGKTGQAKLASCTVAVIGLGGVGSLVTEYLARLGVGTFYLIDGDHLEQSNISRVVGASRQDLSRRTSKVDIAKRLILEANNHAQVHTIVADVAKESVARQLSTCDYLFLAADSMRARLIFNALVHQYLIPGVQLGAKVQARTDGTIVDVMSAVRQVRPGHGCLWCNQLIDSSQLAKEAKTDDERKAQAYGIEEPNPSVISLNAVAAAHGVNDFLLDYLNLREDTGLLHYQHFHHLKKNHMRVEPRRDNACPECSRAGRRYGRADSGTLPCLEG